MRRIFRHTALPAVLPALFFALVLTPVELLGCRNRGLAAGVIALIGGFAGLGAVITGTLVNCLRDYCLKFGIAPPIRMVVKQTGFDLKSIYKLFPGGPPKGACKVALPKPTGRVWFPGCFGRRTYQILPSHSVADQSPLHPQKPVLA